MVFFPAFSWQEEPLLQAGSEERPQGFREIHQGQEGEEEIPQSGKRAKCWVETSKWEQGRSETAAFLIGGVSFKSSG